MGEHMPASKTVSMRALSVRQPWAWAIACGGKAVENRSRGTLYRGVLAIHASKNVYAEDMDNPLILEAIAEQEFVIDEAASRTGAVVAVAEVTGCHHSEECMLPASALPVCGRTGCSPWAARGQHHIELAGVRPLAEPVPCRGALGLWRLPEDVECAVREQLATSPVTTVQEARNAE